MPAAVMPWAARIRSAVRSPITMQSAMVLPVVIPGMSGESAMRRWPMP